METMETEEKINVDELNTIDNGGRRKNGDRRTFCYTIHIPERRRGADRRARRDRRRQERLDDG